jgi:hypothetical protein
MPNRSYHATAATLFRKSLAPSGIEAVAREVGLVRRRRCVTGTGLFWALMMSLGGQRVEFISDVLRTMNMWEEMAVRYKPFWNRLASSAFPKFGRVMFQRLCRELATRVLSRKRESAASLFSQILIDDGSSFAVADGLRDVFPGRFTKVTRAAVELHAHMSLNNDQVLSVALAPDSKGERQFLPPPHMLPRRSLSLRDRGYIDTRYFEELEGTEAYLICRCKFEINPQIVEVLSGLPTRLRKRWKGKQLHDLRAKRYRQDLDLLVAWTRANDRTLVLRLCIRYVPEKKTWTWLLTNLPPTMVSADDVGQLYRLRWQIEHVFKEWKSYANLHALQTNNPHIAEGFIWASLCAALLKRSLAHWAQLISPAGSISTRLAAISGPQIMPTLAAWATTGFPARFFTAIVLFLTRNALRTHPARDRRTPGWQLGLRPIVSACA